MAISISPNDRLFISGRTGSGKTTFVRFLLRRVPRYVVLDSKHTYHAGSDENVPTVRDYNPDLPRQIIRPDYEDEDEAWQDIVESIWQDGNRLIYNDEATLILKPRESRSPLAKAVRTGRERGIGVWTGTQRPKEIPSWVFTEAEHIISFRLQWAEDRKKVISYTGDGAENVLTGLRGHEAMYYSVGDDKTTLIIPRLVKRPALPTEVVEIEKEQTSNAHYFRFLRNRFSSIRGNSSRQNTGT